MESKTAVPMKLLDTIVNYIVVSMTHILNSSKIYLIMTGIISWIASTYVNLHYALCLFFIATIWDTKTRIEVDAKKLGIRFNPLKRVFWLQIKADGLKQWYSKVFKEYFVYIIIAFILDVLLLKSSFHFHLYMLKLDIPTCVILIFALTEFWSIFETLEEAGQKNWIKSALKTFSGFLPEKWSEALNKSGIFKRKTKK